MRETLNQRSGVTGELSPDLWGRTDQQKYSTGFKICRGWVINKRGALQKCPGTVNVMPGKFPSKANKLVPFKISFSQQYCLVFGDQYMHVIKNGKAIFNSPDPWQATAFPNGVNPTITLNAGSNQGITSGILAVGMMMQFSSIHDNGIFDFPESGFILNVKNWWGIIASVNIGTDSTDITVTDLNGNQIDSTTWGAYDNSVGVSTVLEVSTPYLAEDLSLLKWAQSFDIMQLRHHSYPRQQLSFSGGNNWSLSRNNNWPNLSQQANGLQATGGTGAIQYFYKVTSFNKTTKQESLPCPVVQVSQGYKQNVSQFYFNGNSMRIKVPTVTGLAVGMNLRVFIDVKETFNPGNPPGPYTLTFMTAGTPYPIYSIDSTNNYVYVTLPITWGSGFPPVPSGEYAYTISAANQYTILSLSNANPILVTTKANHTLTNGQEVTIEGTGIFGLDGLTFTVTVQSPNTLSLNGVNGANYDLSAFVSSDTTIISPTSIVSANVPSPSSQISISGLITNPSIYTSDTVFLVYASQTLNSGYGFIGYAVPAVSGSSFTFKDPGIPPDTTKSPKGYTPLFIGPGNYPSSCNFYQQRLIEFSTDNNPQGVYASVIGDYNDFTVHDPIQENDAIIINIWSNELSQIFDSAESGFMVLMTDMGPMVLQGDSNGDFTPATDTIRRYMFAGASQVPRPLTIFKNIVYLEANQSAMRDLEILVTPFYTYISKSSELSLFSQHLFQQSPVQVWDYKLYPDSQIPAVRADGKIIWATYFEEQALQSFSWRDTDGTFQDVACVQEGNETKAYVTVERDSGPWVEFFASPYYQDPTVDAIYSDATCIYDGQLSDGTTAVLSGNTGFGQIFTATLNDNTGASYVGQIVLFIYENPDGTLLKARMNVASTTDGTITGTAMEAFKPEMLGKTLTDIRVCTKVVGGLWNLEGKEVSVVGDGIVESDANNDDTPLVVTNGQIQLSQYYGVVNVGLPYFADLKTLDLDEPKGETFMDKLIGVPRVTFKLLNCGPLQVGPDFTENLSGEIKMDTPKFREFEDYLNPTDLFTGIIPVAIDARFRYGGDFCIRSSAPLPATILSIAPYVEVQS